MTDGNALKTRLRWRLGTLARILGERGVKGFITHVAAKISPRRDATPDEFVKWLCFANAGMLDPGNLYCIEHAVRNLRSAAPVVEIGSFCGLSTNVIARTLSLHGARNALITCEPWRFEGSAEAAVPLGGSSITMGEYRNFVRETFIRNVRFFSSERLPHTVECDSDSFFARWRNGETAKDIFGRETRLGGPISFAYVDGNHSYEVARRDFEGCDAYLDTGGFILFDDSSDHSVWEVRRVVREAMRTGRYEVVVKNPNYLLRRK